MASGKSDTWGVCATVNETAEVLEAFVAHYSAIGASDIYLFFDQPDELLMASLALNGRVRCLPSIALPDVEGRPASHEDRQKNNFRHALTELTRSDWLGHVDADELLFPIGDQPGFGDFLGSVAGRYKSVKISPAEAVFGPDDDTELPWAASYARLSLRPRQAPKPQPQQQAALEKPKGFLQRVASGFRSAPEIPVAPPEPIVEIATPEERQALMREVYSPLARKFLQQGLSGHFAGKSFLRRGEEFSEITLHRAKPVSGEILLVEGERFAIVHYDAMSYGEWTRKWRRRAEKRVNMVMMSEKRIAMLDEFRMYQGNEARQRELFAAVNVLDSRQLALLAGAGSAFVIKSRGASDARIEPLDPGQFSVSADETAKDAGTASRKWDGQYHRAVDKADADVIAAMREAVLRSDFDTYRQAFARIGVDRFTDRRKLVDPSATTGIENMVFVAGVHRSGTTLLESLIQERYDVRVIRAPVPENEGQFLQDVMRDEVVYGGPGMFAFFEQSRLEPIADPAVAKQTREHLLRCWDRWTLGTAPTLLEKTPANIVRIPYLRSVFPGARFIIVVRDPRAVTMSVKKWNPSPNEVLFMNWCAAHATALHHAGVDCLFLRYEDLCTDPAGQLARIAEFAGISERTERNVQQTRFEEIRNSNDAYLSQFPKLPLPLKQRLVFRPWEIFGYDLDEAFETA
jgi:hypothetical protein